MESATFTVPIPPLLPDAHNPQDTIRPAPLPTDPSSNFSISAFPFGTQYGPAWLGLRQSCLEWFSFGKRSINECLRFADRLGLSVARYTRPPPSHLDCLRNATIPIRLHGTAFQLSVWQNLLRIPAGQTVSYKQFAHHLQRPKAVRAIARAIAANPVACFIPCHRVIGSSGALTGYRWGLPLKIRLLQCEQPPNNVPHLNKT